MIPLIGASCAVVLALVSIGLSLWSMALSRKATALREEADRIMRSLPADRL